MGFEWREAAVAAVLVAFNLPILLAAVMTCRTPDLRGKVGDVLKEKAPDGAQADATSFSRVTGAIGGVMVGSLFWVVSNIAIVTAILHPQDMPTILGSSGKLFLIGAALFLPYAFNQLKSVLQ
ncbi:MAG: hypothetical protein ACXU82_18940 [Caulobacteraceae bacterium]